MTAVTVQVVCNVIDALSAQIIGGAVSTLEQPSSVHMCCVKCVYRRLTAILLKPLTLPFPCLLVRSLPSLLVCGRLNNGAFLPSPPPSLCCLRLPADWVSNPDLEVTLCFSSCLCNCIKTGFCLHPFLPFPPSFCMNCWSYTLHPYWCSHIRIDLWCSAKTSVSGVPVPVV